MAVLRTSRLGAGWYNGVYQREVLPIVIAQTREHLARYHHRQGAPLFSTALRQYGRWRRARV